MTELILVGRYKDGKKVAPVRIGLAFRTIETSDESVLGQRQTRAAQRDGEWL